MVDKAVVKKITQIFTDYAILKNYKDIALYSEVQYNLSNILYFLSASVKAEVPEGYYQNLYCKSFQTFRAKKHCCIIKLVLKNTRSLTPKSFEGTCLNSHLLFKLQIGFITNSNIIPKACTT